MFDEYDCDKICNCRDPDWNDALINSETDCHCVHCDICGGVPIPITSLTDGENKIG